MFNISRISGIDFDLDFFPDAAAPDIATIRLIVQRDDDDEPVTETYGEGKCANGCCAIGGKAKKPLDMAFEFADMLNGAINRFALEHGLVTEEDFEDTCGVPAWFIQSVDDGTVIEKLIERRK